MIYIPQHKDYNRHNMDNLSRIGKAMRITELKHLAEIKITKENCDEIIAESVELMKQASKIKLLKMQTEERSIRIKRGIALKRERDYIRILGSR